MNCFIELPPPWVIEEIKRQQKHERLHENNQPCVELPLPEPPEKEEVPPQKPVEVD